VNHSIRTAIQDLQRAVQFEMPNAPPIETVKVVFLGGRKTTFAVFGPCPAPAGGDPHVPDWLPMVLEVLADKGKRLTTTQLFAEMDARGMIFSESTVTKGLARECKVGDRLNSRRDARGTGYGLVDWPDRDVVEFEPNALQADVLCALEGKALRTDALAREIGCDRTQLFRKPGGVQELREHGLLDNDPGHGYYRPDAPPAELSK
jgi:hypothetical protein